MPAIDIDYTRHYRKWHDTSEEHATGMAAHIGRLIWPHLSPETMGPALDVGCGMGFAMRALRCVGYSDIEGIDRDAGQVAGARSLGLVATEVRDTLAWLRARRKHYAVVLCLDVIEHVPVEDQLPFVHAMQEALREGGRLICTVPNANSALAARWRYIDWTHTSSFTEPSLDLLLYSAGFRDIRIVPGEVERRLPMPWLPRKAWAVHLAWRACRAFRRLELMAELGAAQARHIPLSLNLLAVASRQPMDTR
jgi:SAM-dependent methyltransferase